MSTRALTDVESRRVRERMKEIAEEEGSQVSAARRLGISQQVYSRILGGDAVGLYVAKRVAKHDRVSVEDMLGPRVPRRLEELLRGGASRWADSSVAVARREAIADAEHASTLTTSDWESFLDAIDSSIGPIVRVHLAAARNKKR
jgi:hypothetical protein